MGEYAGWEFFMYLELLAPLLAFLFIAALLLLACVGSGVVAMCLGH
jgi:hypothetical protein